ncbi:MAG: ABC transporter permease, partial [Ktedonobacterales bacterium]
MNPTDSILTFSASALTEPLLIALALAALLLVGRGLLAPYLARIGLRNVPRRLLRTLLIVFGLMLATTFVASSLAIDDTITLAVKTAAVYTLGRVDEDVVGGAGQLGAYPMEVSTLVSATLGHNPHVAGIAPALVAPNTLVADVTAREVRGGVTAIGMIPDNAGTLGTLRDTASGAARPIQALGPHEVYLDAALAAPLNAHVGDTVALYSVHWLGHRYSFRVRAIVKGGPLGDAPAIITPLAALQQAAQLPNSINHIYIANTGDGLTGVGYSNQIASELNELLPDHIYVSTVKQNGVNFAIQAQNLFGRILTLYTLFALAIGLLLIFLIFTLLAAERRAELGMARAVGMRRSEVMWMLLFEGGAYDVAAASLGMLVGLGLGAIILNLVSPTLTRIGFPIQFALKPDSMLVAFGLGLLFTLLTIAAAAWTVSRMTIAAALRDLPEPPTPHPSLLSLARAAVWPVRRQGELRGLATGNSSGRTSLRPTGQRVNPRRESPTGLKARLRGLWGYHRGEGRTANDTPDASDAPVPTTSPSTGCEGGLRSRPGAGLLARRGTPPTPPSRIASHLPERRFSLLVFARAWGGLLWAVVARGIVPLALGYWLTGYAVAHTDALLFSVGLSLAVVGVTLLLRWLALALVTFAGRRTPPEALRQLARSTILADRLSALVIGGSLALYWSLPFDALAGVAGLPRFTGGIQIFFIAGVMMVAGCVLALAPNLDLLLAPLKGVAGRLGRLRHVARIALVYPSQQRFRTGIGLALFSLVVFTMVVMDCIAASTTQNYGNLPAQVANYDIVGQPLFSPVGGVSAVRQTLQHNAPDTAAAITAVGEATPLPLGVIQPGAPNAGWRFYPASALQGSLLDGVGFSLAARAPGYNSDAQVWHDVRTHPGDVVIDASALSTADDAILGLTPSPPATTAQFTGPPIGAGLPGASSFESLTGQQTAQAANLPMQGQPGTGQGDGQNATGAQQDPNGLLILSVLLNNQDALRDFSLHLSGVARGQGT